MARKPIPQSVRKAVYQKYGGRCFHIPSGAEIDRT